MLVDILTVDISELLKSMLWGQLVGCYMLENL